MMIKRGKRTQSEKLASLKNFEKHDALLVSLSAVFLGLLAGLILMFLIGQNGFLGYSYLIKGAMMNLRRVGDTLATSTVLVFAGLAIGFAYKVGLFNIGVSGQMLAGGFAASVFANYTTMPRGPALICLFLIAILAGGIWGFIPGILKAKFNVNEVVATIMMNWIAYWSVYSLVPVWIKNPNQETESIAIAAKYTFRADWISKIFGGSNQVNTTLVIAIVTVFILKFILNKTTLGFELKSVGFNKYCSEYAGIKVNRDIALTMMISGAVAGLAGLSYYLGYSDRIQIGIMPSMGFDGIAVALLGNLNPIAIFFSGVFFGILQSGKGFMNANMLIPPQIGDTIIAIIIYFIATSILIKNFYGKIIRKRIEKIENIIDEPTESKQVPVKEVE